MSDRVLATFWVPLLAAAGFLLLGVLLLDLPPGVAVWAVPTSMGLGPALLLIAVMFVYKIKTTSRD